MSETAGPTYGILSLHSGGNREDRLRSSSMPSMRSSGSLQTFDQQHGHIVPTPGQRSYEKVLAEHPSWKRRIDKAALDMTSASGCGSPWARAVVLAMLLEQAASAMHKLDIHISLDLRHTRAQDCWRDFSEHLLQAILKAAAKHNSNAALSIVMEHLIYTSFAQRALCLDQADPLAEPDDRLLQVCASHQQELPVLTDNNSFASKVQSIGQRVLEHMLQSTPALRVPLNFNRTSASGLSQSQILAKDFLLKNPSFCAVYIRELHSLEMYRVLPAVGSGFSTAKLEEVLEIIAKQPEWQDSHTVNVMAEGPGRPLKRHSQVAAELADPKRKHSWFGNQANFSRISIRPSLAEYVTNGILSGAFTGGGWTSVLLGLLPEKQEQKRAADLPMRGFVSLSLTTAIAGMALWYPSHSQKLASWLNIDGVTMDAGKQLKLGHCRLDARATRAKTAFPLTASVSAHYKCPLWNESVMWG